MIDQINFYRHQKRMINITPGVRYLSNMRMETKPWVLQAIQVSQRFDVMWFDGPIPGTLKNDADRFGCIAVRLKDDNLFQDTGSFWEAYRNIETLSE